MHHDIKAYNAQQLPTDAAICDTLADEIDHHLPDAEGRIWHRHPVWFLAGNPIVGYSKLKDGVRLLFWSGRSFEEERFREEGGFMAAEIRYEHPEQIDKVDLARWLDKARRIQWDYRNIVKRKGRLERLK